MKSRVLLLLSLVPGAQDTRTSRPAAPPRPLLTFPQARTELAAWMREQGLESKRNDPSRFEVGDGALHLVSAKDSVMLGTEKGFPVDVAQWPRLRMRVRVDRVPVGTDLSRKSGDDAAFRVYVAFDRGGGLISPPHTIAYTWAESGAAGVLTPSAHFDSVQYVTIGSGTTTGKDKDGKDAPQWVTVEVDLAADYRKAFPKDKKAVPALRGIVLKCDSNDTGTSAASWISCLELLPAERPDRR